MSGLVALLLGLIGVVYAAWPWLRGRPLPWAAGGCEIRAGEERDSLVRALRDWSLAAGEVRNGHLEGVEITPSAEVEDE